MGIPTKKIPSLRQGSFYTDTELKDNKSKIDTAIDKIIKESENYKTIYFPEDGFGTGLAKLKDYAPETLEYLNKLIKLRFDIDYTKK